MLRKLHWWFEVKKLGMLYYFVVVMVAWRFLEIGLWK